MKTHVNGINDLRLSLSVAIPVTFKPTLTVIHHDFTTSRLGQDLATEWDAVVSFAVTPKTSLMLKYADFESGSAAGPASRTKGWIMLQYRY